MVFKKEIKSADEMTDAINECLKTRFRIYLRKDNMYHPNDSLCPSYYMQYKVYHNKKKVVLDWYPYKNGYFPRREKWIFYLGNEYTFDYVFLKLIKKNKTQKNE